MKQTITIPEGCKAFIDEDKNLVIIKKEDTPDLTGFAGFEGSCAYLGIDTALPDVSKLPDEFAKALVSNYKLWVIAKAWNKQDGFVPDYDDSKQIKYYAYFRKSPSGFAFRYSDYACTRASAGSGSRLAFKTAAQAKEFGEMFIDLHNDVLLFEK